jgi:hypothetical protein
MKVLLYIALLVGFFNGFYWRELPKGSYYVLNSCFIFLLCLFIWIENKGNFIKFVLVALSVNELLDEAFFDNSIISINEVAVAASLPLFWVFRQYHYETNITERRNSRFNN